MKRLLMAAAAAALLAGCGDRRTSTDRTYDGRQQLAQSLPAGWKLTSYNVVNDKYVYADFSVPGPDGRRLVAIVLGERPGGVGGLLWKVTVTEPDKSGHQLFWSVLDDGSLMPQGGLAAGPAWGDVAKPVAEEAAALVRAVGPP